MSDSSEIEYADQEVRILASSEVLESMVGKWSIPVRVTARRGEHWEIIFQSVQGVDLRVENARLLALRSWLDTYPPLPDDVTGDPELMVVAKVRAILDGES